MQRNKKRDVHLFSLRFQDGAFTNREMIKAAAVWRWRPSEWQAVCVTTARKCATAGRSGLLFKSYRDSRSQFVFKTEPAERGYHGDCCYEGEVEISCWWDAAEAGLDSAAAVSTLFLSVCWQAATTLNMSSLRQTKNTPPSFVYVHLWVSTNTEELFRAWASKFLKTIKCVFVPGWKQELFYPLTYFYPGSGYVSWPWLTSLSGTFTSACVPHTHTHVKTHSNLSRFYLSGCCPPAVTGILSQIFVQLMKCDPLVSVCK